MSLGTELGPVDPPMAEGQDRNSEFGSEFGFLFTIYNLTFTISQALSRAIVTVCPKLRFLSALQWVAPRLSEERTRMSKI